MAAGYEKDRDYTTEINNAVAAGNYRLAGQLEQARNAKIQGEGLSYAQTQNFGSIYDLDRLTDEELKKAYELRMAAQNGQTTWDNANRALEEIRAGHFYSGGTDGSGYYSAAPSPISYKAPEYKDPYADARQQMSDAILAGKNFSYDAAQDPAYAAYMQAYAREGRRAAEDTLGTMAAATGGIPSSAAMAAAAQAGNYYAAQAADKVPELYNAAFSRHLNLRDQNINALGAFVNAGQADYGRYTDNRDFEYNQLLGAISKNQYDQQYADSRNDAEYQRALQKAQTLGAVGDFSGYKALGYTDEEIARLRAAWDQAQYLSTYGGRSGGGSWSGDPDEDPNNPEDNWEETLESYYGGKTLTQEQWNGILQNNPQITSDMMRAAGFKISYGIQPNSEEMIEAAKRAEQERARDIAMGQKYNLPGTPGLTTGNSPLMTAAQFDEARGRTPWLYSEYRNYEDYVKNNS